MTGKAWRVAYLETEPYPEYAYTLYGLIRGLQALGWLDKTKEPGFLPGVSDSSGLWEWLASPDPGPYLQFLPDAHYSLSDGPEPFAELVRRLQAGEFDLLLVMGTVAGQRAAQADHAVPTLVFASSDALAAGIVRSVDDSGVDHVWAHLDPDRWRRQLQVFHDLARFERLGLIYEGTARGQIYAGISDVMAVARERGFDVVSIHVDEPASSPESDPAAYERYYAEMQEAAGYLAQEVDAVYLTQGKWELAQLPDLLAPFHASGIPVFSQTGSDEVRFGALVSLAREGFDGIGLFGAQTVAHVLNGVSPRTLPQVYYDIPKLAVNLEVARRTGFKLPFPMLLIADEIYTTVAGFDPEEGM